MATLQDPVKSTDSLQACTNSASTGAVTPVTRMKIVGATNAAAANVLTVTNASHGQATTLTIPDAGAATANAVVAPAALVSGNLVSASGTAGLVQDSTISSSSVSSLITQVGNVTTVTVTMLTAAVTTAYATPVQLIAAPGAGKVIVIQEATVYTASTGNTAYATGTAPVIQYDNTVHGAGTAATSALATGDITAASSQVKYLTSPTGALTGITNKGIFFSNATNNYTAGTGTNIVITLTYQTITATV